MTDPAQEIRATIIDLMSAGEILEALGKNGSHPSDADVVPGPHVDWLGRRVSDIAGRLQSAMDKLVQAA